MQKHAVGPDVQDAKPASVQVFFPAQNGGGGGGGETPCAAWLHTPPVQSPLQHCAAPFAAHDCPVGVQAHLLTFLPLALAPVTTWSWQQSLQLNFLPFLPRGLGAGHFLPVGIQFSAATDPPLPFLRLARASRLRPTTASRAVPSGPPRNERRERVDDCRRTNTSKVRGSTAIPPFPSGAASAGRTRRFADAVLPGSKTEPYWALSTVLR